MTGPDREAQRDAIIDAACGWAGAAEVIDQYRRDPNVSAAEVARHQEWLLATHGQRLINTVNAYLDDVPARAGGEP